MKSGKRGADAEMKKKKVVTPKEAVDCRYIEL